MTMNKIKHVDILELCLMQRICFTNITHDFIWKAPLFTTLEAVGPEGMEPMRRQTEVSWISQLYSEHQTIYAPNKDPANLSFLMGRHATFGFDLHTLHAWRATTMGV